MSAEHLRLYDAATAAAGQYTEGVSIVVDADGNIRKLSTTADKGSAIDQSAIGSAADWAHTGAARADLVVDRRGSSYTLTGADYGQVVVANFDVTLPVVPAGDVLRRVDLWAFGALALVAGSGVTITGETAIADNGVASMLVASSDGTTTTWRVAP